MELNQMNTDNLQEIVNRLTEGNIKPPISGKDSLPAISLVQALYVSDEYRSWIKLNDKLISNRLGKK